MLSVVLVEKPERPLFEGRSEALRLQLLRPWSFRLYLLKSLPLAFAAGLRLVRLDAQECVVGLPGGWRTRNPFGSTYFAAQAMAAELSTGAPAMLFAQGAARSTAMILVEIRAVFAKRILGPVLFSCSDLREISQAVERAGGQDEPVSFTARSLARGEDGVVFSAFEVTWSFKRRAVVLSS
jgi:hypothetical protein